MRRSIVGIAVALCLAVVILAQGEANDAIDSCTQPQARDALAVLHADDYLTDFATFVSDAASPAASGVDFNGLWDRLIVFRNRYYADVKPELPDCALALRLQLSLESLLSDYQYTTSVLELVPLDASYRATFDNLREVNERIIATQLVMIDQITLLSETGEAAKE